MYGNAAAPPPTPSAGALSGISSSAAADALANLLHSLPSTHLSLPPRRRTPPPTSEAPPTLSFSDENRPASLSDLFLSPSNLGFFELSHHPVPHQLARSADSDSMSLFDLTPEQKESYFPAKNWPLGFDGDAFCLDGSCSSSAESPPFPLTSLPEFVTAMEKLGLQMVDSVCRAVGFENPIGEDPTRYRTVATIAEMTADEKPGRKYPFVIRLQYQTRIQNYSLLTDSGPVTCLSPHLDSVLISLGDILQVWSNGKLKKVRGCWPLWSNNNNSRCVSITVELTLPTNTMLSPLLPPTIDDREDDEDVIDNEFKFKPFLFDEIYAWKVYHSGTLFTDPLDKYRLESV